MSQSWKCCNKCQCPCKNNDICPDTVGHILSKSRGIEAQHDLRGSESSRGSSLPSNGPTIDDLLELERKIEEKLKNMPKLSDHSLHESEDRTSSPSSQPSSQQSTNDSIGPTDKELYLNEIEILRLRLQKAELKNAIIEEKVLGLEENHRKRSINDQRLEQIKRQIIEFIELKFSQLSSESNE